MNDTQRTTFTMNVPDGQKTDTIQSNPIKETITKAKKQLTNFYVALNEEYTTQLESQDATNATTNELVQSLQHLHSMCYDAAKRYTIISLLSSPNEFSRTDRAEAIQESKHELLSIKQTNNELSDQIFSDEYRLQLASDVIVQWDTARALLCDLVKMLQSMDDISLSAMNLCLHSKQLLTIDRSLRLQLGIQDDSIVSDINEIENALLTPSKLHLHRQNQQTSSNKTDQDLLLSRTTPSSSSSSTAATATASSSSSSSSSSSLNAIGASLNGINSPRDIHSSEFSQTQVFPLPPNQDMYQINSEEKCQYVLQQQEIILKQMNNQLQKQKTTIETKNQIKQTKETQLKALREKLHAKQQQISNSHGNPVRLQQLKSIGVKYVYMEQLSSFFSSCEFDSSLLDSDNCLICYIRPIIQTPSQQYHYQQQQQQQQSQQQPQHLQFPSLQNQSQIHHQSQQPTTNQQLLIQQQQQSQSQQSQLNDPRFVNHRISRSHGAKLLIFLTSPNQHYFNSKVMNHSNATVHSPIQIHGRPYILQDAQFFIQQVDLTFKIKDLLCEAVATNNIARLIREIQGIVFDTSI